MNIKTITLTEQEAIKSRQIAENLKIQEKKSFCKKLDDNSIVVKVSDSDEEELMKKLEKQRCIIVDIYHENDVELVSGFDDNISTDMEEEVIVFKIIDSIRRVCNSC